MIERVEVFKSIFKIFKLQANARDSIRGVQIFNQLSAKIQARETCKSEEELLSIMMKKLDLRRENEKIQSIDASSHDLYHRYRCGSD